MAVSIAHGRRLLNAQLASGRKRKTYMFDIDIEEGLRILEAFCRNASQLLVRGKVKGELAWAFATIAKTSKSRVCFNFFDMLGTARNECDVPLAWAQLFYDPTGSAAWTGSGGQAWRSALRIAYTDGTELVLGERNCSVQ